MSKKGYVAALLIAVVLAASAGILSANVLSIGPSTPADHKEALAAAIPASVEDLGKLLFFDPRLSGDTSISCSTCHVPQSAWTDETALSAGYQGTLYFRNTPTIINAGRMPLLDWDGRFAAGDMDSVVRDHLAEAHFMNVDGRLMVERLRQVPVYEEAFKEFYGSDVSYGKVLNALSTFVASRNSTDHPYLDFWTAPNPRFPLKRRRVWSCSRVKAAVPGAIAGNCFPTEKCTPLGCPKTRQSSANPCGTSPSAASSACWAWPTMSPFGPIQASTPSHTTNPTGESFERRHCSKPPVPPHTCTTESSPPWKMSCASTTRAVVSTTT